MTELIFWQNTPAEVRFPVLGQVTDYEGINMRFVKYYIPGAHLTLGRSIISTITGQVETEHCRWEAFHG